MHFLMGLDSYILYICRILGVCLAQQTFHLEAFQKGIYQSYYLQQPLVSNQLCATPRCWAGCDLSSQVPGYSNFYQLRAAQGGQQGSITADLNSYTSSKENTCTEASHQPTPHHWKIPVHNQCALSLHPIIYTTGRNLLYSVWLGCLYNRNNYFILDFLPQPY